MGLKKYTQNILTVFFVLLCVFNAFADEKTDRVDEIFARWDNPDIPGCAIAIIKDGEIIYKRGYGMANLENDVPITPQSIFYIGSVSKQFVAMSIALLSREGKLSLDDNIRKHIPELPDYGTPITIRHLIHHTSGLRDYLTLEDIAGIPFGYCHEEDVLDLIVRQKELNFNPGEEHLYSNSGYFLLAVIIHRASGKKLRQYADENIFKPLGMKNSRFHDDYTELIKNRASGYLLARGKTYTNFISTFDCVGSGGLFTSVEDLYLWDQNFYDPKVGGEDIIELMHTVGTLKDGTQLEYAFALDIKHYKGLKTVSHGGALGGYRSELLRFPEQKFSVICLSNLSSFNPSSVSYQVADIYLSEHLKEEREKPENIQTVELAKEILENTTGTFTRFESGEKIRVSLKGGRLYFRYRNRNYTLAPLSESEFLVLDMPRRTILRFEKQEFEKPLLLHVFETDKRPQTYTSSKAKVLGKEKLSEYEGRFSSEELQVTFQIKRSDGGLRFVHKKAPRTAFKQLYADFFQIGNLRVRFVRDEANHITGFLLDAGRVRNLQFTKRF
jgi:CubicO group peptidase (beta-lactamase class C family)